MDLSDYAIERYSNGSATLSENVGLIGTLATGAAHVVVESGAQAMFTDLADQTGPLGFNGDDAIVLRNTDTNAVVDSFGQVGFDPGEEWYGGGVGTKDINLRRTVTAGDTNPTDVFDPSSEWTANFINQAADLGSYNQNCPSGGDDAELTVSLDYIEVRVRYSP